MTWKYPGDTMQSFLEKLANSHLPASSSDHLKLLGKRAAGTYMRKEADSLNAAVASSVDGEGLNREQLRRVVELANQSTWNEAFHVGGDAISFDPADAGTVLGEMDVTPEDSQDPGPPSDYSEDVPNQVQDVDWKEAFGLSDDSPEYALVSTGREEEQVEKVAGAVDVARYGVDRVLSELSTVGERFYQMVKQAHLQGGHGILQISQAVGQAVQDPHFGVDIMKQASARMRQEGVRFNEKEEMLKVAHPMVVNTDHPLVQTAAVLEKLAFSYYASSGKLETLRKKHRVSASALRDKLRGA